MTLTNDVLETGRLNVSEVLKFLIVVHVYFLLRPTSAAMTSTVARDH